MSVQGPRLVMDIRALTPALRRPLIMATVDQLLSLGATETVVVITDSEPAMIGCAPGECLMVGDDRAMDMPAATVGMRTFYVGSDPEAPADHRGTMTDLAALLQRLA